MLYFIFVLTGIFLLYLFYIMTNYKRKIPSKLKELPYIKGLPIIGVLHQMKPTLYHYLTTLSSIHGPIFKVNVGMRPLVVINDYRIMKKAMKENGDNFSGRMKIEGFRALAHHSGIIFEDGVKWAKQRSFILKVLRDFGLGKSKSMSIVVKECMFLLEELEQNEGSNVDFSNIIPIYTANIISKFIMNRRFIRDDPNIKAIEQVVHDNGQKVNPMFFFHFIFPILDNVEWLMKYTDMGKFDSAYNVFQEEFKKHKEVLDLESEGEDLFDRFLIEQNHTKKKTGSEETFTYWQLIRNAMELFTAGYETTSTTLTWSLMFVSKFPHIQNKVYKEILEQIGDIRLPNINDKKSLNYTQAVMDEVMRMASTAPLAIHHRCFNDCEVNGYFIPKDSVVIPNIYACHFDPKVWEKPNEFYPEHFLQQNEQGEWKYNPREELIIFSMGKRQCLGESLARMEYFVFFTSIIQKFHVRLAEDLTEEQYNQVLVSNDGFIRGCSAKNFVFKRRL